ncbi:MAG: L,D-transpeptidase family protein [Firmicutes bacterium]|nr:L,D-transpeptidase family protein [Bacillota bacterium]
MEFTLRLKRIMLIFVLLLPFWGAAAQGSSVPEDWEQEDLALIFEKIKASVVFAEILADTPVYDGYAASKSQIDRFFKGEKVEIIRDRNFEWYQVRNAEGRQGWIAANDLFIPEDPETNREWLPNTALEAFVNSKEFKSRTDQLVWVDLDRQLTHVFVAKSGEWKIKRSMPSSTGKNVSPTLRGLHEISERGDWFFTERLARGAKYWVKFSGPYLFHSLPMDKQGNITDYTLLERRSSGCIRLSMEDSIWFYSFIKRGTAVFVN